MTKLLLAAIGAALTLGTASAQINYSTFNYPLAGVGGSTYLTGIRHDGAGSTTDVFMTGVYTPSGTNTTQGLLYQGSITSNTGTWNILNYPSAPGATVNSTALYGPNDLGGGVIRAVGSYKTDQNGIADLGLLYEGTASGAGSWLTLDASFIDPSALYTIAHSTHGDLVVGNYDTTPETGKAFVYNITAGTYVDFNPIGATSITAYGVWHNGGTSYTIAGGFSLDPSPTGLDEGYLVDWDSENETYANFRAYNFDDLPIESVVSHFDGITGDGDGGYYLTGDYIGEGAENGLAFYAAIGRNELGFSDATWTQLQFTKPGVTVDVTSGNSVYENYVIGIYVSPDENEGIPQGYVATIPEPASASLAALSMTSLLALRRRRS